MRRWHGHYSDNTLVPGLVGLRDGGSLHQWRPLRRLFLCDALALGPRGLGDEGVLLCLAGRVLPRAPASFSSYIWSGGAGRVALTGLNFNGRLGSATGTVLAGLFAGIGHLSSRFGTTLAGVALTGVTLLLLCPSLLRRLGPSSHGLP